MLKPYYESKKNNLLVQKLNKQILEGEQEILKRLIKWKSSLLTYLEKRNCRKLSEIFRFCVKSHERFTEKDALKNACDGVASRNGIGIY